MKHRLATLAAIPLATVAVVVSLAGCPAPPPTCDRCCKTGFVGDRAQPLQLEIVSIGQDLVVHPVDACGSLDIIKPPQGGKVLFIGVRATNLDGCGIELKATLRDVTSRASLGGEIRTVNLIPIANRPGWVEANSEGDFENVGFSSFANVAVCPNHNVVDIQRQAHILEVKVTDKGGRTATASAMVIPRCRQHDPVALAECECTCEANDNGDKCGDLGAWEVGDAGVFDAGACSSDAAH